MTTSTISLAVFQTDLLCEQLTAVANVHQAQESGGTRVNLAIRP